MTVTELSGGLASTRNGERSGGLVPMDAPDETINKGHSILNCFISLTTVNYPLPHILDRQKRTIP